VARAFYFKIDQFFVLRISKFSTKATTVRASSIMKVTV
jgi:hypothetical protein